MREQTQAKFTAKRANLRNPPWSPSCLYDGFRALHLKPSQPSPGSHPHNIRYNFDTISVAAQKYRHLQEQTPSIITSHMAAGREREGRRAVGEMNTAAVEK